jgi:hypothetical protein
MGKEKKEIKLLWMNGWFGLLWLILFIPCFLYFVNYELYLNSRFSKTVVTQTEIVIPNDDPRLRDSPLPNDGSQMIIITDKGWFSFRNPALFDKIIEEFRNVEHIEIWYNEESRGVADIRINQSYFIIPRERVEIILFLSGLILSGISLIAGMGVVIKTKGWGDYDLLEKYPKGLLGTIFKRDE